MVFPEKVGLGSIFRSMSRIDRALILACLAGFVAGTAGVWMSHDFYWVEFFTNLNWTSSCASGALFAWHGLRQARKRGDSATPWQWFLAGLAAKTVAQIIWAAQVFSGWTPFPGPSDLFSLMLGPAIAAGIYTYGRPHFNRAGWNGVLLDTATLLVAMFIATIVFYLPHLGRYSWFQLGIMAAYPAGFWVAASLGMMLILHMRARFDLRGLLLIFAMLCNTALWDIWNLRTLSYALMNGSSLNIVFSSVAILTGVSAAVWRLEPKMDASWQRLCEFLLRLLPLFMVVVAVVGVALTEIAPGESKAAQPFVLVGSMVLVLLAMMRQVLTLEDRDQLLVLQAAALKSQVLLKTIIDTAPIRVFWKDIDSHYLGGNSLFAKDAGIADPSELIGRTDSDMVWKAQAEITALTIRR